MKKCCNAASKTRHLLNHSEFQESDSGTLADMHVLLRQQSTHLVQMQEQITQMQEQQQEQVRQEQRSQGFVSIVFNLISSLLFIFLASVFSAIESVYVHDRQSAWAFWFVVTYCSIALLCAMMPVRQFLQLRKQAAARGNFALYQMQSWVSLIIILIGLGNWLSNGQLLGLAVIGFCGVMYNFSRAVIACRKERGEPVSVAAVARRLVSIKFQLPTPRVGAERPQNIA